MNRRELIKAGLGLGAMSAFPFHAIARSSYRPYSLERTNPYLKLPEGFHCSIVSQFGDAMNENLRVPAKSDGMGAFWGNDSRSIVLMRNHELDYDEAESGPYKNQRYLNRPFRKDPASFGGVSRIVLDSRTYQPIETNLVLEGTEGNCAGGVSPWGWLSCEESVVSGHGHVYLCPTTARQSTNCLRIDGFGRFNHEAVAYEPSSGNFYLTEDRIQSCLYRFVPDNPRNPFLKGRLQAMVINVRPRFKTYENVSVGESFQVSWVDLEDINPKEDTLREEAQLKGAAIIRRGEGISEHRGIIYICSTTGGPSSAGQIFSYQASSKSEGYLKVLAQSQRSDDWDMPDNICVSPNGNIYMAEDREFGSCHLQVLTPSGKVIDFAKNIYSSSELAGICFSPKGDALFVNMQGQGITFCIKGPVAKWDKMASLL